MKNIINQISKVINKTCFEDKTYIVGGFVRDEVMGKESNDLDIVVEQENGGIALAEFLFHKGMCSRPVIFKRFGTAMVEIDGYKIEFVMTRKESYPVNSRKPEVQIGSIKEDVERRDFTINALILDISSNKILDKTQKGLSDIEIK